MKLAWDRQVVGINQQFDASGGAGFALDKAGAFEGAHHLVNRRRCDSEVRCMSASAGGQRKPWQKKMWCIPKVDAEYVARMEDVLDLYAEGARPPATGSPARLEAPGSQLPLGPEALTSRQSLRHCGSASRVSHP
jgi:hypothetical protein